MLEHRGTICGHIYQSHNSKDGYRFDFITNYAKVVLNFAIEIDGNFKQLDELKYQILLICKVDSFTLTHINLANFNSDSEPYLRRLFYCRFTCIRFP